MKKKILGIFVCMLMIGSIFGAVNIVKAYFGDVVDSFDSPGPGPEDLAWDGDYLWNADNEDDKIYKLDNSGNIEHSFNSQGDLPSGLTWDGDYLWHTDLMTDLIYKLDPITGNEIKSFESPGPAPRGLTWDGTYLWNSDTFDLKIYKLDTNGNVKNSFPSPSDAPWGLAWDGTYLWNADASSDKIYKLDPATGNELNNINSPSNFPTGLTCDGYYLWNADRITDKIYKIDVNDISVGEAVDNTDFSWAWGGDAIWYGQNQIYHYDDDAAQSAGIDDNENVWIKTDVTGPGELKFWWKVSSEPDWDFLRFKIDDNEQDSINGSTNWEEKTYTISSGSHELKWVYDKDQSISDDSDCGWLDYVTFTPWSTITFQTDPTTVGSITFDEITYVHGNTVQKPPQETYDIIANTDPFWGFSEWITTGGVSVAAPDEKETIATVTSDGTLKAKFYYISLGEAVDNTDLTWDTGGNGEWFGQDEVSYYDGDAAQSGDIENNENVWIKTEVTGPVQLKFWWKVDSQGSDYLRFKIDGDEKATYSGFKIWDEKEETIESGTHTLEWVYDKDGSGSSGSDCGWLDKVRIGQMYTIDFYTNPSDGGSIIFDESTYYDGDSLYEVAETYSIEAIPSNNHEFDHWSSTEGITITNPDEKKTTATVNGDGTITAWFSYYFVHITDPHVVKTNQEETRWKYVINTIKSWDPAPKFVVCTGDLVDHGKGNPTAYDQLLDPLVPVGTHFQIWGTDIPIYFCPGNHDARHGGQIIPPYSFETYHDKVGPDYYTDKVKKSYAIFSLNGGWDINPWPPGGPIGDYKIPEGEGLRDMYGDEVTLLPIHLDDLDQETNGIDTSDYVKILLVHQPWLTKLNPIKDGVFWYNRGIFETYCQNYDVDLVLSGHIHDGNCILDKYGNDWSPGDGTRFIITNGIKDECGYRNITINPTESNYAVEPGPQGEFDNTMTLLAGSQGEGHGYDKDQNHIGLNENGVLDCDIPYASVLQNTYYDENEEVIGTHTEMSVFRKYDQEYDFEVKNLCSDPIDITLITSLKAGYESKVVYENVPLEEGGVAYISVDNAIIVDYWIDLDIDGDNIIDANSPPSSFEGNLPPETPDQPPEGPTNPPAGEPQTYTAYGIDPDYQYQLWYLFSWGNGEDSGWIGPKEPSESAEANYTWDEIGTYEIKFKTKDQHDVESKWSPSLPIEVPYIYQKPSGCIQGTSVTMALDNPNPTKPIEAIRVGDVIQSYNPQTQQVVSAEVIEVYEYTERLPEIYLIFNNNLEVTPRQTLYRDGIGWMKANDAQIGYNIFENPPSTSEIFSVPISLKVEMPLNPSTRLYDLVIQPLTGKACGYWANGILVGGYN